MATVKKESNDAIVFRVMRANADKSRDEVIALLMTEVTRVPPAVAAGKQTKEKWLNTYYAYAIRKGIPGQKGTATRSPSTKAAKAPKAPKSKLVKVPAPRVAGDKEKAAVRKDLTVEEINDIKAKNLARMKAVSKKYAAGRVAENIRYGAEHSDAEARAEVAKLEDSLDSFSAPKFLKLDEVKALV